MAENSGRETGGGCSRCESSPEVPAGPGTLYLWAPLGHTAGKVRRYLKGSGREYRSAAGGGVALRLEDASMTRVLSELSGEMLTSRELTDTRALFKPGGEEPTADDIPEVRSLKQFAMLGRSEWLLDLLSEGRLTSVFQPIVRVEDTSEVFAQECLLRGVERGGGFIPPQTILDAARECGMLFQADLAARRTAIREAADHGIRDNLFVNFSPTSIYDPVFCLRSTVEAVDETGLSPENVVFEVTETEEVGDPEHLRGIVSYYRDRGFRIALDDLGSGYSSLNLIHRLRPDFVKLDLHLIRDVDTDPYKAVIARKLLELARSLGVQTIVEGVETLEEMRWIRAEGTDFVQGYLIARPSSPPVGSTRTFQ